MSRESAYRLAARPSGAAFAVAWQAASAHWRAARRRAVGPSLLERLGDPSRTGAQRRADERILMRRFDRLARQMNC